MSQFRSDFEISKIVSTFVTVISDEIDSLEFDL